MKEVARGIYDDVLNPEAHRKVAGFLRSCCWVDGWRSRAGGDGNTFFHRHFAGAEKPDHPNLKERQDPYDCADELRGYAPWLYDFWSFLHGSILPGHTLVRCYANAMPYGADGTVHTDSASPDSWTAVYFPHDKWSPNWNGEFVLFNKEETEITFSVYPKPNRLIVFNGTIPHVARGVSRTCPMTRVTLMFKTIHNFKPSAAP